MRIQAVAGILACAQAIATASALAPASALAAGDVQVSVQDNRYSPATITVTAGTRVTWTNTGSNPHSVTADGGSFDSNPGCTVAVGCMSPGQTFSYTFTKAGSYAYHCRVHGTAMSGTVVVTEAASATPAPEPTAAPATPRPVSDAPAAATRTAPSTPTSTPARTREGFPAPATSPAVPKTPLLRTLARGERRSAPAAVWIAALVLVLGGAAAVIAIQLRRP